MFILGAGALARPDGAAVLALAAKAALSLGVVKDGWNGFNVLHTAASRVGGLDLGFAPGQGGLDAPAMAKAGALDVLFNLGADEIDVEPGAFVVYIGTHGDRGAHRADVILPGAAYTEKTGIYVNTEGRPQFAERAVFPPGDAREDWAILRALSDALGARAAFRFARPRCAPRSPPRIPISSASTSSRRPTRALFGALAGLGGALGKAPFASAIVDFYLTNPIARASRVMAECSALARRRSAGGGIGRAMTSARPPARADRLAAGLGVAALAVAGRHRLIYGFVAHGWAAALGAWLYASSGRSCATPREPRAARRVLIFAHPDLRRPQDLGGGAVAPRAERRRPVGRCCRASPTS